MPKVDEAVISCTGVMRRGAIVVSMLGAKAPAASLPKGTLLNPMTGFVLIAPETIREFDLVSPMSLAEYCATFSTVFFFDIRWALGSEDTWNPMVTSRDEEGRGGRGTCGKEMLLKAGMNCTGS